MVLKSKKIIGTLLAFVLIFSSFLVVSADDVEIYFEENFDNYDVGGPYESGAAIETANGLVPEKYVNWKNSSLSNMLSIVENPFDKKLGNSLQINRGAILTLWDPSPAMINAEGPNLLIEFKAGLKTQKGIFAFSGFFDDGVEAKGKQIALLKIKTSSGNHYISDGLTGKLIEQSMVPDKMSTISIALTMKKDANTTYDVYVNGQRKNNTPFELPFPTEKLFRISMEDNHADGLEETYIDDIVIKSVDSFEEYFPKQAAQATPTPKPTATPAPTATPQPTAIPQPSVKQEMTDIKGHWAEKDIAEMVQLGLVNGKGEGIFDPEGNVTRAEFAALVLRAIAEQPTSYNNAFSDVKAQDWYANTLQKAYDLGIIHQAMISNGSFNPNQSIGRQEMAFMVTKGYEIKKGALSGINAAAFKDRMDIDEWCRTYVDAAVELGLIKGTTADTFSPDENATRAQAAVIIKRLFNGIK